MIFIDPSELRADTRLHLGDLDYTVISDLEEVTGADCMISAWNAPANTPRLIELHIQHKALLVQRKHKFDLIASLDERLKSSLYKMRATGAKQAQCILLFIGVLTCDRDNHAVIDGQDTGRSFWSVHAGLSVWNKYGGVVEPFLSRATLFPDWVRMKQSHVQDTLNSPTKEFSKEIDNLYDIEADDPVQELILVKDWRRTVSTCPGWGKKRIDALRGLMVNDKVKQGLLPAIYYMTTLEQASRIRGVGQSLVTSAITWSGITESMRVNIGTNLVKTKGGEHAKTKRKKRVEAPVSRANPYNRRTRHR